MDLQEQEASGPWRSAAMGLAISAAVAYGYSNIFVTVGSPSASGSSGVFPSLIPVQSVFFQCFVFVCVCCWGERSARVWGHRRQGSCGTSRLYTPQGATPNVAQDHRFMQSPFKGVLGLAVLPGQ